MRPTKGSAVVLKTMAPNGPAGSRVKVSACSVRGVTATTGAACLGGGGGGPRASRRGRRHEAIARGAEAVRFARCGAKDRADCAGRHTPGERPRDLGIAQFAAFE